MYASLFLLIDTYTLQMEPSESERMLLLEQRLRHMEAALQGGRPRITMDPQAESRTFRRSSSPEATQVRSRSLTRQGALTDISMYGGTPSQQVRANRGTVGPIDSRALTPISARYEHGLAQIQTPSQASGLPPSQPFQPFLGLQSLSANVVSTSHVNQARRASAAAMTQRRQNGRAPLGSTGRGAAPSRAPRGPPRAADPAQLCYTEDSKIRLQVRVYPPDVSVHPYSNQLVPAHLFPMEG